MSCNCVHEKEEIENGYRHFDELRELFIRRMTVDSETKDRRRKDFNQAIFYVEKDEDVDAWNRECERYGFAPKEYGETHPAFDDMDMDMVLQCFDDAVKDWRRTFCSVEGCKRK